MSGDVKRKLDQFADRILGRVRFFGLYRYRARIADVTPPAKPDLVPINVKLGLPVVKASVLTFGTPGMSGRITNRTIVVIAFEGGDPASPFAHSFVDGEAYDLTIEVSQALTVRAASSPLVSKVALVDPLLDWVSTLGAHVSAIQTWMGIATPLIEPPVGPPGPLALALTATGATRAALSAASTTLGQDYPAGAASTKIKGA